jgi:queuine tRNA-ribosyltransferase
MSNRLGFQIEKTLSGSNARAGRFRTLHNEVQTPLFMPVGTQATVKAQTVEALESSGSQILLANTYHLLLRPGPEVFKKVGGIQKFMNWPRSVLTDSGGYQIFSLSRSREMNEEGARFQSYVDNRWFWLTPEVSIETQKAIGSDIMMVLDQCVHSTADLPTAQAAMELTHRWARRSFQARGDSPQSLFGIVQGACYSELRKESALTLAEIPFDGFAIGGLAVGESKSEREDVTAHTLQFVPRDRPRYLMGVGTPLDILEAVHRGIDMFDCIIPTSFAQRGTVFTSKGKVQLRRSRYRESEAPLDSACACSTCSRFSRAYLHHLIKTEEVYGWQLLGAHNIWFYHRMMDEIRTSIFEDRFLEYFKEKREVLGRSDAEARTSAVAVAGSSRFEVVDRAEHSSIYDRISGETMHSVNDPMLEARSVYVEQSMLARRLEEYGGNEFVIWDVGLGAAANAMAAVECYENLSGNLGKKPALQLVSFENDLGSLEVALHSGSFEYLSHPGPESILERGDWERKGLSWSLLKGDFKDYLATAPAPDLIYYDPFSIQSDPAHWDTQMFKRIFDRCQNRDVELFTYSSSTSVRVALLLAGFWVAPGRGTGPKATTTIAMTPLAAERRGKESLLGTQWLERWKRSGAKFPPGMPLAGEAEIEAKVLAHPQFA